MEKSNNPASISQQLDELEDEILEISWADPQELQNMEWVLDCFGDDACAFDKMQDALLAIVRILKNIVKE